MRIIVLLPISLQLTRQCQTSIFQLNLAMGTALMESKCFLGFRLLSTNITIPGIVVGKVFAFNVTLDGHLAWMAETATEAFVTPFGSNYKLQQVLETVHKF